MHLDVRVLAATLGFALIAAVLSGMKPALRLSQRDLVADLRESRRDVFGHTGGARRPPSFSVVGQITLSVVLVMGGAMFTRSAQRTSLTQSGVAPEGKLIVELDSLAAGYDLARTQQVYEDVAVRLKSMPGVQAVSLSALFPFVQGGEVSGSALEYVPGVDGGRFDQTDEPDTWAEPRGESTCVYAVEAGYFEAVGIPLLRGRAFRPLDGAAGAERVVIIDESLARKLRPNGDALGLLILYGGRSSSPSPSRVVGIAPNLPIAHAGKSHSSQIYVPMGPDSRPAFIHVRVVGATEATLLRQIPVEIRRVDPHIPMIMVSTLMGWYRNSPFVWLRRFGARLAAVFGAMALFLASLGIYAVKGHMVTSRTREIGIRKALGATHWDIVQMVFREGLVLTAAGLVLGLAIGLGVARLIASLLYGVEPVDGVSIAATVLLLAAASLLAAYVPARRAARVDPMVALRYE